MCMFNNQTTKVNPSNTILLGGRCRRQGQLVHYLGYFNQVNSDKPKGGRHNFFDDDELFALMDSITGENRTNRHSQPRVQAPSFGYHAKPAVQQRGNAMLIPIPAVKGTFSAKNLIPLGRNNTVFADYARAITAPEDGLLSFSTRGSRSFSPDVEVVKGFDDGLYDLVIASSAAIIPSVLDSIAGGQASRSQRRSLQQTRLALPWLVMASLLLLHGRCRQSWRRPNYLHLTIPRLNNPSRLRWVIAEM
jgi:hypothetical protein